MRYLLLIVFVLSLGACKNPKIETLEAEKAGLILLYEKEVEKSTRLAREAIDLTQQANEAAASATVARAEAELALEDAKAAQAAAQESARLARIAQAEAELQKAAYLKCMEGK